MPLLKTYDLFISHAWRYDKDYDHRGKRSYLTKVKYMLRLPWYNRAGLRKAAPLSEACPAGEHDRLPRTPCHRRRLAR